jgi:Flp pilus assembly protein TadD
MSKLTMLTAAAAGYVLGARAGRERYEQIAAGARSVARNPKVQSARKQTQAAAAEKAKQAASTVSDKVSDKVGHGDSTGGTHAAASETSVPQNGTSGPPLS